MAGEPKCRCAACRHFSTPGETLLECACCHTQMHSLRVSDGTEYTPPGWQNIGGDKTLCPQCPYEWPKELRANPTIAPLTSRDLFTFIDTDGNRTTLEQCAEEMVYFVKEVRDDGVVCQPMTTEFAREQFPEPVFMCRGVGAV